MVQSLFTKQMQRNKSLFLNDQLDVQKQSLISNFYHITNYKDKQFTTDKEAGDLFI